MRNLTVLMIALLAAGCASTRIAVLQNPDTKQTAECKVDPWGSINYGKQVDTCIATYQKAGYRLLSDSAKP